MRKLLLLTIGLLASTTLMAQTTGELYLQGEVLSTNDIVIAANANATSLNIVGGEIDKNVATATETSNNLTGYVILMRSLNGSQLNHTTLGAAYSVPYTLSYDGMETPVLINSDQVVKTVTSLTQLTVDTSDILINMTPQPTMPGGFYSDVVTISIAATN